MRKNPIVALVLAIVLMLGSVSVGASEVSTPMSTPVPTQEEQATVPDEETTEESIVVPESVTEETEESEETEVSTLAVQDDEVMLTSEETTVTETEKQTKTVADDTVVKTNGAVSIQADGKAFVKDSNGKRITEAGTPLINGKKYWVKKDGYLGTGWLYLGNWKMYFDPDTYEAKFGMADINGKRYLFNEHGVMQNFAGTTIINGKKYWFSTDDASLKNGWLTLGSWKLYFDKETYEGAVGVKKIDGKYYLFNSDGILQSTTGTPLVNGKKYWITKDGSLGTGWLYLGNWKMYFDPSTCEAKTGMADINGKRYLFNEHGVMQNFAGTTIVNGKKYWFSTDDASLKTGWLKLGSWKLYFDPVTYAAITDQIATINGEYYHFNSDGIMSVGFKMIGTSYYYFNADGTMLRNGSKTINGTTLKFGADGICTTNVFLENYNGPYKITVDRTNCVVTIYGDDGSGNFAFPIKAMVCSVGLSATPTPTGTFRTGVQQVKKELMGPSWGQYSTHIVSGIYFHSVSSGDCKNYKTTVPVGSYYMLGKPASHGCVRLLVGDAKWIYDNIPQGTMVGIGDNLPMPLGKPSVPTMVVSGVDPTDPNPYG